MSMSEMKEQIATLAVEERLEIAALIAHLNRRDDPSYHAELERRLAQVSSRRRCAIASG